MTSSSTIRKRIGLLAVAAGSTLALGSIALGGIAHATPPPPPPPTTTHALHNATAATGTDCPDTTGDYWHFVTSKNDGTYTFVTITLNLGDAQPFVASGALIIKNGTQTDNVFVRVPTGHVITDLHLSGSFAEITPAGTELFNLSHVCDGSDGGTTTTQSSTPVTEETTPVTEATTPPTDSQCEGDSSDHHEGDDNEDCTPVTEETTAPTEETTPKDTTPKDTTPKDTTPKDTTPKDTTPVTEATIAPSSSATATTDRQSGGPVPTNPRTTNPTVAEASGALPSTGSSQALFLVLGLAMVLGGVIFVVMSRRPDEA